MTQNKDYLPSIPPSSIRLLSRTSSLLPIPARRDTSLSPAPKSPTNSSLLNQRASPSRPRGVSTTQRPSLTPSHYSASSIRNPSKIPSRQPSSPSTPTSRNPPTPSLRSFPSSVSLGKPAGGASAAHKKPSEKAIQDQATHFRSLTKSFSHVPRKAPSLPTANNTPTGKPHPFPVTLASSLRLQRPGGPRPVTVRALSPVPASHNVRPPSAITFQKTRTITSHSEIVKESSATTRNAGQVSRAIPQFRPPPDHVNASPESIQSKITLTDCGSSIRMKLEYPHHPSVTPSPSLLSSKVPETVQELNNSRWPADIDKSPQAALPSKLTNRQQSSEPQEFQSRAYTLEKLQSLIGTDELQRLINPDALYQLISRTGLYETQQDLQERVSKEPVHHTPDPQNPHGPGPTPLGFDYPQTRTLPSVPCATLKATAHLRQPSGNSPSPLAPPAEAASAGPDPGHRKSNYVGNILLEKLGWKSGSTTRNPRPVTPKATGKSRRPSSFILISSSIKGKLPGQQASSGKPTLPEQRRYSQILGAKLEMMNCSTCVVRMGERYHVLPVICFNVIEEIYRRGMQVPGIMRISGDLDRIDELVAKYESCPKTGLDMSGEDIHTLCGLLKHYLRTLPEPLFHPLLSHLFWKICVEPSRTRQADPTADEHSLQLLVARYLLQLLPSRALSLLTYVIRFLAQIPFFAENRIQHDSLAVMLGPALFVPRDMGLPGLGLHPRRNNGQTNGQTSPRRLSPQTSVSYIEDVDKNAVSQRAAESTLWLMNHANVLFDPMETPRDSAPSVLSKETLQEATPPQFLPKDLSALDQRMSQSPPSSPLTSILTYTSDLSVSQQSTIGEEPFELTPLISSAPPEKSPFNDMNQLDEFGFRDPRINATLDNSPDYTENTPKLGLGLQFPSRLDEQAECTTNGVMGTNDSPANQSHQLPSHVLAHPEAATSERGERERRDSAKVIGLLTHYMEGRDKKLIKQETLIESLVQEIGRLQTVEEREKALREQIMKQVVINPVLGKKLEDSPRSDGREGRRSLNPIETSPSLTETDRYIDYHEQMFNPSPSSEQTTVALAGSCSSDATKRDEQDEPLESEWLPSDSTALHPVNPEQTQEQTHKRRLSKIRLLGSAQENQENEAVEELRPGKTSRLAMAVAASPSLSQRSAAGTAKLRPDPTARDPFCAVEYDEDYDSDLSNTASLRSEISRLRSINSSLIRKLKSIESIIGDVSFH